MKIFYAMILGALVACGSDRKDRRPDSPPEQPRVPPVTGQQPQNPPKTPTGQQPQNPPETPTAEESCRAKGARFSWDGATCLETARKSVSGTLSAEPGLLWEANASACDEVQTQDGLFFRNCAGIDATIPLASLNDRRSVVTVSLRFTCIALSTITAELTIGESLRTNGWAPSAEPTHMTVSHDAGETGAILIKMTGFEDNVVKDGCRMELLKNEAAAFTP